MATIFWRVVKESLPTLMLVTLAQMATGVALNFGVEIWIALPALLVLVPPINDLGNDIACVVSSKVTTLLALGLIRPGMKAEGSLRNLLAAVTFVVVFSTTFLAFFSSFFTGLMRIRSAALHIVVAVCLMAGLMLMVPVVTLSILTAFVAWRLGLDPDNVTIPILPTVADLLGVLCVIAAAKVLMLV